MLAPLRFVLALLVVLSHTTGYPHGVWPDPGLPAVICFFFLSGVLMPAAFDRDYTFGTFGGEALRFTLNRLLKIFPLYWIALAAAIWLNWRTHGWEFAYALENPHVFIQNVLLVGLNQVEFWGKDVRFIGPAWTLDIELQFYLLTPLFVAAWRRFPRVAAWAFAGMTMASLALLFRPSGVIGVDKSLLAWFCCFAPGFMLQRFYPGILNMLNRGATKLLMGLGELSYPIYLIHRPLLEIGLGAKATAWISRTELTAVYAGNVVVSVVAAVILQSLAGRFVERLRDWVRNTDLRAVDYASGSPETTSVANLKKRAA